MSPTIAGAWELVSTAESGLLVATNTHASMMIVRNGRTAVRARHTTDADDAAAYRGFIAQSGPYTITGSRLIHHRNFTRDPASMGTDEEFAISVTADTLVVQSILDDGSLGEALTWRRSG